MSRKYGQGLVPYAFRISPELKAELLKIHNANEFIREAIREKMLRAYNSAGSYEEYNRRNNLEVVK